MNLKLNTLIAAFEATVLLAPHSAAETAPACRTGKLLDVQENTEFVPTVQISQARRNKNGSDWITVAMPPTQKQTAYVVKVALDGVIYTVRSSGEFWAYKPSSMIVNSAVEACVDANKLVITRPDGKQYKPTIIRREREQSTPSAN